jgi:hypothetical protein
MDLSATDIGRRREVRSMKRSNAFLSGVLMAGVAVFVTAGPAAARGPGGGGGPGGVGNAGGAVRGLERAEEVAAPQGRRGIENAEQRIDKRDNPKNPNTDTQEGTDKATKKTPSSNKKASSNK